MTARLEVLPHGVCAIYNTRTTAYMLLLLCILLICLSLSLSNLRPCTSLIAQGYTVWLRESVNNVKSVFLFGLVYFVFVEFVKALKCQSYKTLK